jgi:hypothetical protein
LPSGAGGRYTTARAVDLLCGPESLVFVATAQLPILVRIMTKGEARMYSAADGRPTHSRTVNYNWRVPWSITRS